MKEGGLWCIAGRRGRSRVPGILLFLFFLAMLCLSTEILLEYMGRVELLHLRRARHRCFTSWSFSIFPAYLLMPHLLCLLVSALPVRKQDGRNKSIAACQHSGGELTRFPAVDAAYFPSLHFLLLLALLLALHSSGGRQAASMSLGYTFLCQQRKIPSLITLFFITHARCISGTTYKCSALPLGQNASVCVVNAFGSSGSDPNFLLLEN
jgi:hypothetical protein